MPRGHMNYAAMFTLRSDGRYMGYWHDEEGRHAIYDRDPESLYRKIAEKEAPPDTTPDFSAVAEAWEGEYRESISVRSWNNLRPHYEDIKALYIGRKITEVTAADVNADFLRAKAKGYGRTVVNNRRVIYNGIFNYAVVNAMLPYNPAQSVKLPKGLAAGKRQAPTDEQIKIICKNTGAPFGFFPFFLLCTGLRKAEALALLKSDFDLKAKTISVTKALTYDDGSTPSVKTPKTEAGSREVPIIDALLPHLKRALDEAKSEYLFPASPSNRNPKASGYMSAHAYDGAWARYCTAVGLTDENGDPAITAHHLRHGTATLLFESGVDVYTAQRILGHANVRTTMEIYTNLREKQNAKSVKKFNRALSRFSGA